MEIKKLIVWVIIWVIALFITIPKSSGDEINYADKLDLPSVVDMVEDEIRKIEEEREVQELEQEREKRREKDIVSRGTDRGLFTATAYDLSVQSCGKKSSHPAYGITANGTSLKGHTLESARAIAVDPKVIKLGSKVHIEFLDDEYKYLNGIFLAVDTGSAIKGKKIDLFFGDTGDSKTSQDLWDFGKRKIKVTVINE